MNAWLTVVGIGEDGLDGLSGAARATVAAAETLVGGERHLAFVPPSAAERLVWTAPIDASLDAIAARRGKNVVVLASGDPMWFGIGATLARRLGADALRVLPHVSAFALAAARLGWALADCACLSLHGRPRAALAARLAPGARILALTQDGTTPAAVAADLAASGWAGSRLVAFERLGGRAERRIDGTAAGWREPRIDDLNTLAIECVAGPGARVFSRLAGLPDDAYEHDGQLTKRAVRAATLAALAPLPGELLWDVGAGNGSVAIEWLRADSGMRAVAIERDAARLARIARNSEALGVPQLKIVAGSAPAALEGLDAPDAVFVGGGSGTPGLIEACWTALRPGGRLVANAVTLEGEAVLAAWHARAGGEMSRFQHAQAEAVGPHRGWRPAMQVTQLSVRKP
jgi:precorrin-6Y C5,15-methyltransferase (decarboxylating)